MPSFENSYYLPNAGGSERHGKCNMSDCLQNTFTCLLMNCYTDGKKREFVVKILCHLNV